MKIFSALYHRVMRWAAHPHAQYYLAGLSFTEASFFPIPPDVMLAPMALAKPERAWWYASLTTLASTIGALLGYVIGAFFFAMIKPVFMHLGYADAYQIAYHWFVTWGVMVMFIAAFTPIPFKVFTITAGLLHMALLPFFFASLLGRGSRFFLVSGLMRFGGEPMERVLRKWIDWIGWSVFIVLIVIYLIYKFG